MIKIIFKVLIILSIILAGFFLRIRPSMAEAPYEPVHDPLFEKIADCESKNDLQAKNPYSTASGEFQFLTRSWKYYGQKLWGEQWVNKDIFSTDNRDLAWYVYTNYGTRDWEADRKSYDCWKSAIPLATHKDIF